MAKKAFEKTTITAETYSAELKTFTGTMREVRRQFQQFLLFAFDDYAEKQSPAKLLQLYKVATRHGLDKKQILAFIKAHANIRAENVGKSNVKFAKRSKTADMTIPVTGWWYNYDMDNEEDDGEIVKKSPAVMAQNLVKALTKGIKDHTLTNDVQAQAFINYVNEFTGFNECDHVAPEKQAVNS